MSQRPSFTARRRANLARRVESLEAMESRSLITESLGILTAGIGFGAAATALAGTRRPVAQIQPSTSARTLTPQNFPALLTPLTPVLLPSPPPAAPLATESDLPVASNPPTPSGDWLTLSNRSTAPPPASGRSFTPSSSAPQGGGGAGGSSHGGSGATTPTPITPLQLAAPSQNSSTTGTIAPVIVDATPTAVSGAHPALIASGGHSQSHGVSGGSPIDASGGRFFTPLVGGGGGMGESVGLGSFTNFPLYTLDYNDGVVLIPGSVQKGTLAGFVDLRAQVRDTSVSTYSWDTTHLGDIKGLSLSGTSTSRLQFEWTNNIPTGPATDSVTLTVTNSTGQTEVQTYAFVLPTGFVNYPSGGSTVTWPETLPASLNLPGSAAFATHNATIDANTGAAATTIALPSYNPNIPGVVLGYNSLAAAPQPVVVEHHTLDPALGIPSQVSAQLTFNGTAGSTFYYNTSQFIPGDIEQIAPQASATALATGRYAYSLAIGDIRGTTTTTNPSGTLTVLNRNTSPIGAGWTVQGLEQITTATGGVILDVGQGDSSLWFSGGGGSGGGTYTSPAGDFSVLTKNTGTGTYLRTLTNGTTINFNSSGQETSVVDRNNLTTTFAYTSGALTTITDPYAKVTTFAYTSGELATITDPAGRVTTFTHTGANLTAATLPDSHGWSYGYDGSGRLTRETDPNSKALTVTYDGGGLVSGITQPDSTTEAVTPYQRQGWVPAGSGTSGSPAAATLLAQAVASFTDPNSHTNQIRPDWNGLGQIGQTTDPDGNVATSDLNANGLATVAIDRLNRISLYTYDSRGNVSTVTYPDTTTVQTTYNSFSEPLITTNQRSKTTSYTYDGTGNKTVVQDALSNLTTMTYTGNGRVATIKDARSNVTSYQYDSQDRLTTITYPGGATTLIAYDTKGNATTVTDQRGKVTTGTYDSLNRLTSSTDPLGNRTTTVYDNAGNRIVVQAPLSRTTTYAYDSMNRVTTITDPLSHATVSSYDSGGNLIKVTDALSRVTTLAYDAENRRTAVTDPLSHTTTTVYDAAGEVVQVTDPLGRITTTTYNSRGWAATVTDPLGNVTTYTYTATGKPSTASAPVSGGSTESLFYDDDDRLTSDVDALSHTTSYGYDSIGNQTTVTDTLGHTTTSAYDSWNRLTTVTDPLGDTTVTGYDSGGNQTSVSDPNGHTSTKAYDSLNRATTLTDANGGVTTIAYDAAGRQTGLTDPMGNHTTWAYDAANRVTTMTSPNGSTTTYVYDSANQLTDKTDPNGRRVTYGYDSGGRQTGETWVGASPAETIASTYDADGELTVQSDSFATLTYTYDSGGRQVTAATSSSGGQPAVTLTSGYDGFNDLTSVADNLLSARTTSYAYDANHRLTAVTTTDGITKTYGGAAGPQVVFGYDNANRLTSESRTIAGSGTAITTSLSYDNANRMTSITHQIAGGSSIDSLSYVYDSGGRVSAETNHEGAVTYSYDNSDQITGVSGARVETYTYDSGGNRTMTGYGSTTGNEMTSGGGYTYIYDNAGNQTSKTLTSNGNNWTYTWDDRNRLTVVVEHNSGGTVLMQGTYTYDPMNRRIGVDETVSGVETKTWTVYNGVNPYADFNGSGTLQERYLYGPAVDQILARTNSGGTSAWYLIDRLGSIRDIANTSGTVLDHIAYDSYGNVTSESNASNGDKFKFDAMQYDTNTVLNYDRARWYDSSVGRFVSKDPSAFAGRDTNLYRYVSNSPVDGIDPSGENAIALQAGASLVTSGGALLTTGAVAAGASVIAVGAIMVGGVQVIMYQVTQLYAAYEAGESAQRASDLLTLKIGQLRGLAAIKAYGIAMAVKEEIDRIKQELTFVSSELAKYRNMIPPGGSPEDPLLVVMIAVFEGQQNLLLEQLFRLLNPS